jgi:hypothetical protein
MKMAVLGMSTHAGIMPEEMRDLARLQCTNADSDSGN